MSEALRKLNDQGIDRFREYIRSGASGSAPRYLLSGPDTSSPLGADILVSRHKFADRVEFGEYLNKVLAPLNDAEISSDQGFWTALALLWFDLICPQKASGGRKTDKEYRYILSSDYRHYYRHLVRSPWQLVRDHGESARFLLTPPREAAYPLSVHGEVLEQFGGRQQVLASRRIIAEASKLYLDPLTKRPRKGVAGSGAGSARRFALVLRQLDLTYDPECMVDGALLRILPREFDRWKPKDASGDEEATLKAGSV